MLSENRRYSAISTVILLAAVILTVFSAFLFPDDLVTGSTGTAYTYTGEALITLNGKTFHSEMNEDGGGRFLTPVGEEIAVTLTVPSLSDLNYPALFMRTGHENIDIMLDGDVMFSQDAGYLTFQMAYPIVINIPKSRSGSMLTVIYRNESDTDRHITVSPVVFGDRHIIASEYFECDFIYFLFCVAVAIFSVMLFCFSLFFRKKEGSEILMSISSFTFASSVWLMTMTDYVFSIIQSPVLIRELSLLAITFIPSAMTFCVKENLMPVSEERVFRIAEITSLLFPLLYASLTLVMMTAASQLPCTFRDVFLTVCMIIHSLFLVIHSLRNGDREVKYRFGSLAAILIFTVSVPLMIVANTFEMSTPSLLFITSLFSLALLIQQSVMICIKSITRKEKRDEMMKRLYTDSLTGMLNRRAFEDRTANIVPGEKGMHVISADIDGMKRFNDTLGHGAGDELITAFSKALTSALSNRDGLCFRMGGDEFLILLKAEDDLNADSFMHAAADDFSNSVTSGSATFSYGTFFWAPDSGMDFREALRKSDEALLIAKEGHHRRLRKSEGFSSTLPNASLWERKESADE
ncbi:MAG: GGDEF domain-containing protein [Bullifex sp.]